METSHIPPPRGSLDPRHSRLAFLPGVDPALYTRWHSGRLCSANLAVALRDTQQTVDAILGTSWFRADMAAHQGALPAPARVGLAVAQALHRLGGLPVDTAVSVVANNSPICEAIAQTLDFMPDSDHPWTESDPLLWFAPHACEEIPLASVDECIELINGRHLCWSRPEGDARARLQQIHDAGQPGAAPTALLDAMAALRNAGERRHLWLGCIGKDGFVPAPQKFSGRISEMASTVGQTAPASASLCTSYKTKIAINLSLAARSMKRRALGLRVDDGFHM